MVLKLTIMAPEELALDPQNPRLWRLESKPTTQDELENAVNQNWSTAQLHEDILRGRYQAPEPLLVIRQRPGHIVIDGNRRLSAIRRAARQNRANQGSESSIALREISVAIMRSRETAKQVQIRRHRLRDTAWAPIIMAMDMLDRLRKGQSTKRIANHYGLTADETGEREVTMLARCLQLTEKSKIGRESPARAFHWLLAASSLKNIPTATGATSEAFDRELTPEEQEGLEEYLAIVLGYAGPEAETLTVRIKHTRELPKLDAIFGDDQALAALLENTTESIEYAHARLTGSRSQEQTREAAAQFRDAAETALATLARERRDLIPNADNVSLGATALAYSQERGEHLSAEIRIKNSGTKRGTAEALAEALQATGYPRTAVTIAR